MKYALGVGGVVVIVLLLILPLPTTTLTLPASESEPKAVLLFGGDMMFDRYIRQVTEIVGGDYVFSCIASLLLDVDGVVANLEGPITNFLSVSVGTDETMQGHFSFTFPSETAEVLKRHNFLAVNLGNNHIANFGREGIEQTKAYLNEAGISYFGAALFSNSQEFENSGGEEGEMVARKEINGVSFSFISYNEFSPQTPDMIYHIRRLIEDEKELGSVVVVYTHWGEEYVPATEKMKTLARQFVDAGASLVVGSHPHVVQESERYKDVSIYYSLGNFVFDQYFSEAVRNGLLLEVTFDPSGVESIKEIPIVLNQDGRTCLSDRVSKN